MGKRNKPEVPTITLTYDELASDKLQRFLERAANTPVDDVRQASRLGKIYRLVKPAMLKMREQYVAEIQTPHQAKMDAILKPIGKTVRDLEGMAEAEMAEFNKQITPEIKAALEAADKELGETTKKFGERTIDVAVIPIGPSQLKGIKVSAAEIQSLQGLYDEDGDTRAAATLTQLGLAGQATAHVNPEGTRQ